MQLPPERPFVFLTNQTCLPMPHFEKQANTYLSKNNKNPQEKCSLHTEVQKENDT